MDVVSLVTHWGHNATSCSESGWNGKSQASDYQRWFMQHNLEHIIKKLQTNLEEQGTTVRDSGKIVPIVIHFS